MLCDIYYYALHDERANRVARNCYHEKTLGQVVSPSFFKCVLITVKCMFVLCAYIILCS